MTQDTHCALCGAEFERDEFRPCFGVLDGKRVCSPCYYAKRMIRMDENERSQWFRGVKELQTVKRVHDGLFHCDHCASRAVSISHQGVGSPVRVECAEHFKARLAADRLSRPSRSEMLANINRSLSNG